MEIAGAVFDSAGSGYHAFRIPTVLARGELVLAFCEGRLHGSGDAGGTTSAVTANRFAARTRSRRLPLFGGREGPSSMDVPTR